MERWVNLAGYQIAWLITVSGAARGMTWPAVLAASLLCGGHLLRSNHRRLDLLLIGIAVVLGVIVDGFLASSALLRYTPADPAVPALACPVWILALWAAFSTTLTRSLGWLRGRIGISLVFGAVGGPLAYWAAARGWGVITFTAPKWPGVLALATGWAIALAILVQAAGVPREHAANIRPNRAEPDLR